MGKKSLLIISAALVLLFLVSCDMSERKIIKTVRTSLQKSFNTDPQYMEHSLKLTDLVIVKKAKDSYQGTAKIEYKEGIYEVPLFISIDGTNITWDLAPDALAFLPR